VSKLFERLNKYQNLRCTFNQKQLINNTLNFSITQNSEKTLKFLTKKQLPKQPINNTRTNQGETQHDTSHYLINTRLFFFSTDSFPSSHRQKQHKKANGNQIEERARRNSIQIA
jgi:hypothetical protein